MKKLILLLVASLFLYTAVGMESSENQEKKELSLVIGKPVEIQPGHHNFTTKHRMMLLPISSSSKFILLSDNILKVVSGEKLKPFGLFGMMDEEDIIPELTIDSIFVSHNFAASNPPVSTKEFEEMLKIGMLYTALTSDNDPEKKHKHSNQMASARLQPQIQQLMYSNTDLWDSHFMKKMIKISELFQSPNPMNIALSEIAATHFNKFQGSGTTDALVDKGRKSYEIKKKK